MTAVIILSGPDALGSKGPVGLGPFGGSWQHLVLQFGPCPRVAPLHRAPPERLVRGISTEPRSPRNRTRPDPPPDLRSPAKPGVAALSRHRWDGGECTGHARSRAGPESPGGGASWRGARHLPRSSAGPSAPQFPPSVRVGSGGIFCFQSPVGKLGIHNPRKTFFVLSQPLCDLG